MSEAITCPRRMSEAGPWEYTEGLDSWTADNTCSFCGSTNPQLVLEGIKTGKAQLGPTDKNYKVYVEGLGRFRKCYFQHFSKEQRAEFIDLLNSKTAKIRPPGYFYVLPFFLTVERRRPPLA